ncbi:MAG: alanine--tRNA ligase [Candidatus Caenarcaniphilales bacterium]|nr:alanine--tRNA ligase [Candidatus Caenarcaniphilales bacterium]
MKSQDIRRNWIEFFTKKKAHKHLASASLVPNNPTLLLTNAGMVPFVPYFLGQEKPPSPRVVSVQKCVRVGGKDSDLENIGKTSRHLTFFEMLGNFSFGDYFKEDVIPWAWELLTEVYKFNPEQLIVSVFEGDDKVPFDQEAYDIWHKKVGVPESRIVKYGRADNFWGPPGGISGPCGPCSEIYFDPGNGAEPIEIWNLVFMQYEKFEDGSMKPLPKPNVDTGAGLERMATILQNKESVYETDLMQPIIDGLAQLAKLEGFEVNPNCREIKIVADHLRCAAFLIADGVKPSNLGRGYVLRMLIRRAARFAKLLGFNLAHVDRHSHLVALKDSIVSIYPQEYYPELTEKSKEIVACFESEIDAFNTIVERGLKKFNEIVTPVKGLNNSKIINGEQAFDLYATYGFPVELTVDLAEERGFTVDLEAYQKARETHSEVSNQGKFAVGFKTTQNSEVADLPATEFVGYERERVKDAKVLYVSINEESGEGIVVLDKTPFYAESGGQMADKGIIKSVEEQSSDRHPETRSGSVFQVVDVNKIGKVFIHKGKFSVPSEPTSTGSSKKNSEFKVNEMVIAEVDQYRRQETRKHHTATHLLQAALRKVLGPEVQQAGSQVDHNKLRFDFAYPKALSKEQISKVENFVNDWVSSKLSVETRSMPYDEAIQAGALAFFEDKYDDEVRVLSVGHPPTPLTGGAQKGLAPPVKEAGKVIPISIELCGGTHVSNTKEIGLVKILSESAIAAGTRRIEMIVGESLLENLKYKAEITDSLSASLKTPSEEVFARVQDLQAQVKEQQKQISELQKQLVKFQAEELLSKINLKDNISYLISETEITDLKSALDFISSKLQDNYVLFLVCKSGSKPSYAAKVKAPNIKAKELVSKFASLVGGTGGGRDDFAQGGGGESSKISLALTLLLS